MSPTLTATAPPVQYPATWRGVMAALDALGGTGAAVAGTLTAGGYAGRIGSASYCPIAKYLHAVVPALDPEATAVGVDDAGLWDGVDGHAIDVDLPEPVVDFIAAFDGGAFPDLGYWLDNTRDDADSNDSGAY